jgi:amidophosphoribosyltransferase
VREVEPGEVVVIDAAGCRSFHPFEPQRVQPTLCLFEFVYFARPDAKLYGRNVHLARRRMGMALAEQAPLAPDAHGRVADAMVVPVPESGVPAAQGYAEASGIPYGDGFVKNRYIGRTFIAPTQELRANAVRMKLNPLKENVVGKRLVVVDDSIVRGTTSRAMVRMLREAGAAEVHLRIMSPPYRWPCFYGMDTGDRSELIAANLTVEEIRDFLGVDSLAYLTLDRLVACDRGGGRRVLQRLPHRRLPGRGPRRAAQGRARAERGADRRARPDGRGGRGRRPPQRGPCRRGAARPPAGAGRGRDRRGCGGPPGR